MINVNSIFKAVVLLYITLFSFHSTAQRNVILIIADDLGSDYCGFYENHLDTVGMPNIRRLLDRGVRFRNAWSNPLCSPTRAGILTGRYSFRTGVGNAVGGAGSAVLDTSEITIPRLLNIFSPNGFAKANIGKWHLHTTSPPSNYNFPNIMGYDHFEGNFTGVLTSFTNWVKVTNGVSGNVTNYATTETVNNAVTWIKSQNKPFFLWLAFNAPHTPHHLPPQGLYSDTTLSGTPSDINANPKKYFKASVEALDHEIGRLFDTLQFIQQWDSTEIIFIGDNGNSQDVAQNTTNAKGTIYQEGVSVPYIISGPSVVNPNRVSEALVNTHDLFATILELLGYAGWQSQIPVNKPVDSKSLMPIIKNQTVNVRDWIFTEIFKNPAVATDGKAMRNDIFKLLDFDNGAQRFYNLMVDSNENINLLIGTLNTLQLSNYNYLCNEMTNLVGIARFCDLTDVHEINVNDLSYSIYPNPFKDYINIDPSTGQEYYKLFDVFGQLIYSGYDIKWQNFLHLADGIYFLEVTGRKQSVTRLVKI